MADPFEEFQFQPLTEGLGFHKKTDKKGDAKPAASAMGASSHTVGRATEAPPRTILSEPPEVDRTARESSTSSLNSSTLGSTSAPSRSQTQSISDLIASLPPSLDFIDNEDEGTLSSKSSMDSNLGSPLSASLTAPLGSSLSKSASSNPLGSQPSFDVQSAIESTESYAGRPQIFQPLAREDYKAPASSLSSPSSMSSTSSSASSLGGPTVGSFLPPPGTKAANSVSSTNAATIAPLSPAIPAPTVVKAPSPYRERLDESFARAFPHAEKSGRTTTATDTQEELRPVAAHLGAGLLDAMVVTGLGTILLVCILAITRINLVGMLSNAKTDGPTQMNLVLLFIAVLHMYLLTARAFFGSSLGEWAFDLQLGNHEQQRRAIYPLQVIWRTVLITITGFLLLPLLSLIARRDLSKYLTGLQLYHRP